MRVASLLALSGVVMLSSYDASAQVRQPKQRIYHSAPDAWAQVPSAGTFEWCLGGNPSAGSCNYRTLEQCVQDRQGQGGYCSRNPSAGALRTIP